jgi:N-acetylmuramoyl-L-alanine amidase
VAFVLLSATSLWIEPDMRLISEEALAVITIMQEAAGEPYEGKVAVAEVIRNRMNKKYASDGTVSGTVLRPLQFSGWNAKDPGRIRAVRSDSDDKVVKECIRAWHEALAGTDMVKGAVLYYNPSIITEPPDWALPDSATQVAVVGQHHFFVPKPRRGSTDV